MGRKYLMQNVMRVLLWGVGALCYPSIVEGANLHVIIAADTLSENIRPGTIKDIKQMKLEIRQISRYTDLKVKQQVFDEYDATSSSVLAAVRGLAINSDDVVLFYFTGHGYRTPSKGDNPWPNFFFPANSTGIDMSQVAEYLKKKNPQLVIIIGDCCNNVLSDDGAPPIQQLDRRHTTAAKSIQANYRKLFLETTGVLLMSAAIKGEVAYSSRSGAIFTNALSRSLAKTVGGSSENATWQMVLDRAAAYSNSDLNHPQHPQYQLIGKE